jgi:hypothetical protein
MDFRSRLKSHGGAAAAAVLPLVVGLLLGAWITGSGRWRAWYEPLWVGAGTRAMRWGISLRLFLAVATAVLLAALLVLVRVISRRTYLALYPEARVSARPSAAPPPRRA